MQSTKRTVPLSARFLESDVEKIADAAEGNLTKFVRDAIAEKMANIGKPISTEVGSFGGKQTGAGRPVGSRDRKPRKVG